MSATTEDLARMDEVSAALSRELASAYTTAMLRVWPDESSRLAVQGVLSQVSGKLSELRGRLREDVLASRLESWRWFAIAETQHDALADLILTSESDAGLWSIARSYFGEVRTSIGRVAEAVVDVAEGAKGASEALTEALPFALVIAGAVLVLYLALRVFILLRMARGG
jgi:hypothetical protein